MGMPDLLRTGIRRNSSTNKQFSAVLSFLGTYIGR